MARPSVIRRHCNCIDFQLTVVDTSSMTVSTTERRVLRSEIGRKTNILKFFNELYKDTPNRVVEAKKLRFVRCLCNMSETNYFYNSTIIETKEVN